jgi:hypothetical protein
MSKAQIYKEVAYWLDRAETKIYKGDFTGANHNMLYDLEKYITKIEKNRLTKKFFDKYAELDAILESKGY